MRDQPAARSLAGPAGAGVRRIFGAAVVMTFALIVLGGIVRVTGSGMGCGGDWPLCDGRLIPPLGQATPAAAIEFGHRLAAAGVGVLVLAGALAAWLRARWLRVPALLAVALLVAQIGLGAVAARMGLSAWAAVLYLGMALALLAALLVAFTGARLGHGAPPQRMGARAQAELRLYRALVLGVAGLAYIVMLIGALAVNQNALWACVELPVCSAVSDLASIQLIHRIATVLLAVMLVALAAQTWRARPERGLLVAAGWTLSLTLVQVPVGIAQLLGARAGAGDVVALWRSAHLALGAATWGGAVVLAALALRAPQLAFHVAGAGVSNIPQQPPTREPEQYAIRNTQYTIKDRIKDYISLTKPRVITLLIFTTIASMFITPAGTPGAALVFWTFLGGWLMSSGAHSINCYLDRDIDLLMGRTGRRPLPGKRIPAVHALIQGLVLGGIAFVLLGAFVNWLAAALALAGLLYYVFIYTAWLKRTSVSNIVIGGGAGAFPPLVGWAAATGSLTLSSLFLFAIIFYWTPPHFWALALIREKDYARAGVPMLPVVAGDAETKRQILLYTLLMFMLTIMLTPLGIMGLPYLIMALVLGGLFLRYVWRLRREGTTGAAWGLYRFSLLYLALLFVAMVVDRVLLA
jgi:heme o synthase